MNPNFKFRKIISREEENIVTSDDDDDEEKELEFKINSKGGPNSFYQPSKEIIKNGDGTETELHHKVYHNSMEYSDLQGNIVEIKEIPKKSDYVCWWDCHKFDTSPFFAPKRYSEKEKKFYVYGNFCSANCTLSYILQKYGSRNNTKLLAWFRMLCKKIYKINISDHIHPAPSKECLKLFGGKYTIDEFRDKFNTSKVEIIEPPLFLVIQDIHETITKEKKLRNESLKVPNGINLLQVNESNQTKAKPPKKNYRNFQHTPKPRDPTKSQRQVLKNRVNGGTQLERFLTIQETKK